MSDTVDIHVSQIKGESGSGNAIQVVTRDGELIWLPLSQVEEIHRDQGDPWLKVSRWIAEKKDLL